MAAHPIPVALSLGQCATSGSKTADVLTSSPSTCLSDPVPLNGVTVTPVTPMTVHVSSNDVTGIPVTPLSVDVIGSLTAPTAHWVSTSSESDTIVNDDYENCNMSASSVSPGLDHGQVTPLTSSVTTDNILAAPTASTTSSAKDYSHVRPLASTSSTGTGTLRTGGNRKGAEAQDLNMPSKSILVKGALVYCSIMHYCNHRYPEST